MAGSKVDIALNTLSDELVKDTLEKVKKSIEIIEKAISMSENQIIAYSGGKDGIVAAHIANKVLPGIKMICETSFYFEEATANIKEMAEALGFDVTYECALPDEWLVKNKHVIFNNESNVRSWSFTVRHQRTVKKFAKLHNACAIYGRRSDENNVPKEIYETKAGLQCHPLRAWKEENVWAYFRLAGIPIPMLYLTKFGRLEGNCPFYSLNKSKLNFDIDKCWDIVSEVDKDRILESKFRIKE